ncbi:SufD family Fe-S cluster assembly protein [Treponema sp.]|uniref:SufB/SufD family protein n=1 Tax=Treponema sp. TaxID=166 RepID=UPI00298DBD93|nr:SufD family Fe-S cluster assembly protein [Treponema sp.]MCR5613070.1 SufD family Fe-S cluster assembly protein [Treponema sp.]
MKIESKVNQIPSLTWNWLKINNADVKFNAEYKEKKNISVSKLPSGVTYKQDDEKYLMSIVPIETGFGKESNIFSSSNVIPDSLIADAGTKAEKPVYITFDCKDKAYSVSSQIITAQKDADITVIMTFTSDKKAEGMHAVQTKLYAHKNAKIHLVTVQMLGDNYIHFDDIGTYCEENAHINVTQILLGSKKSYVGVHALLKEYMSSFKSDTAYFCRDDQLFDMNYVVTHTGRKTDTKMQVNGTLKDSASKTYRGTIDFKNGCQGAEGEETENTLLLNPTVVNKSIPVILCDEEDVAGEHGATIGKLSDDVLFYMSAHGIDKTKAEKLMCLAKINQASHLIPDTELQEKISDYVEEAFNG